MSLDLLTAAMLLATTPERTIGDGKCYLIFVNSHLPDGWIRFIQIVGNASHRIIVNRVCCFDCVYVFAFQRKLQRIATIFFLFQISLIDSYRLNWTTIGNDEFHFTICFLPLSLIYILTDVDNWWCMIGVAGIL